ncbi:ATP-binding cassette domain-containing protein [Ancylobacter dichloromethanicus]|uniref:ABC transporter n=1 Tax=Ancylobacter dichloromethanicus TaxID=518825 RepID=A0A9W6JA91_9HYPH|nr:ATP-binding cassette domain-containing protein [Ancylobacter dichloromethanicus]MBS7554873.1 ATP-binding cassette domain-containing protein [Ancylobacter dichloromethanicus]GLK73267.1 ABC transporter [Ancylobacter dichloromethanicus]
MPGLDIRDLVVGFPGLERPALDIPELVIPSGAHVALTGPSGSGKTTFINIVTGLERAPTGRVAWGGTDIAGLGEGARDRWRAADVGLVMQEFHLFPGLSALENVLLPQRLATFRLPPSLRAEANRLLARVGIGRPGQKVETLSRGQMQRVAVARALVARPGIIVADEPTASLDADAGAAVAELLAALAREVGATLLVATHDDRLIAGMERLLRLESGRLMPVASAAPSMPVPAAADPAA